MSWLAENDPSAAELVLGNRKVVERPDVMVWDDQQQLFLSMRLARLVDQSAFYVLEDARWGDGEPF
jgi:hypothetical protein